jgi:hypothetical protein
MKFTLTLCAALLMAGQIAFAKTDEEKQAEIAKSVQNYQTPGDAHKVLAGMAGKWRYEAKSWNAEGAKPAEAKGTTTLKMILNGRFLQHEMKLKKEKFEGIALYGYNKMKEEFESLWIDNMSTGFTLGRGKNEGGGKVIKQSGETSNPFVMDKDQEFRNEWKIIDKDNMIFSMFSTGNVEGGSEFKVFEMIYKRAK